MIPQFTRHITADTLGITALREQLTDVRNRQVATSTHLERIDHTIQEHEEHIERVHKSTRKAGRITDRINEEIDTVRTAITAIPDLLQRILEATEANTERLNSLRKEGLETRENLEEMDERITLLLNEERTERPPSPTNSIRSAE